MPDTPFPNDAFLQDVISVIEDNLSDESFGVAELAAKVNMSRSNLLRRVKSSANISVSVLIRQVRLQQAQALLKANNDFTVSEVAFQVGFSSTSYFIRCYREAYGHTPGEENQQQEESKKTALTPKRSSFARFTWPLITALVAIGFLLFIWLRTPPDSAPTYEKTIAVLPFSNDSDDTTNVYLINGLMVSILDHLQKIEDLNVRSRTTVEKFRDGVSTSPEIAAELDVSYLVEGSGQRIGDEILLSVSLIDAKRDQQIWSKLYKRKIGDIFQLQTEVATSIAQATEALITPEEQARIAQIPTDNLVAYDYYLKGLDRLNDETGQGLQEAITLLKQAITQDPSFAQPHAYIAIAYYYIDLYQVNKFHGEDINTFADRAILLDEDIAEGLIAKALFYMQDEQYELAIEYFEKVLRHYPHSAWVHNFLTEIYHTTLPDTKKYLNHAIRSIRLAVADQDSTDRSYTYLSLANALAQTGFLAEAKPYLKKSLDYNPQNRFSELIGIYLDLGQTKNFPAAQKRMLQLYQNDTTRLDVLQELAKLCYHQEDYTTAWRYYERLLQAKEAFDLDIYAGEDIKIAFVLEQLGRTDEAQPLLERYLEFAENSTFIYRDLSIAAYYSTLGETQEGIKYLEAFTEQSGYFYWLILFLEEDPIIRKLSVEPTYEGIINQLNKQFWEEHETLRKRLVEEGLI